jgi:hypothetical protein
MPGEPEPLLGELRGIREEVAQLRREAAEHNQSRERALAQLQESTAAAQKRMRQLLLLGAIPLFGLIVWLMLKIQELMKLAR